MGFAEAIKTCFRKSFTFSGRASRSEFWYYFLFASVANMPLQFIPIPQIAAAISLAVTLPILAAAWRRLNDTEYSALQSIMFFLAFALTVQAGQTLLLSDVGWKTAAFFATWAIGFVCFAIFLFRLSRPSQPAPNRYGPNPNEVTP